MLDSELMHSSEGEGLEQGQRGLCGDVMLSIGRHRHVLLRTGQMLDSELMYVWEGEGLEQGQRDLRRGAMLSIGGLGQLLFVFAAVYFWKSVAVGDV
jgi:hypothetical protein